MATGQRWHLAHPQHMLLKTQYDSTSRHSCDICCDKLSGLIGYRCNACDFDIHEECADYFKETISFFAHPWHTLTASTIPDGTIKWSCDICRESCPAGTLVYRCTQCGFDVHPMCTLFPQTFRSPLHPQHDLNMVPSWGGCSSCQEDLPVWHYHCGICAYKLHIECATSDAAPSGSGSSHGAVDDQNAAVARESRRHRAAKFLVNTVSVAGNLASVFSAFQG
uniref:Phorbol-ester/DAG-type domain-containing protein n=1 Tax=Leersia perrieri TaxID=77586 RepID=A0A0D9X1E0_9ORYZ